MHVYKELTQPTVVTHSLAARFTSSDRQTLAVVRGSSLLQLFELRDVQATEFESNKSAAKDDEQVEPLVYDSFIGSEAAPEVAKELTKRQLVLIGEWSLDGNVNDIGAIRTSEAPYDCLVLSFRHAKMTVMLWDPQNLEFAPLSMHMYEKELDQHFTDYHFRSYFKTDPHQSCICMVYQKDCMAFLPLIQEESLADEKNRDPNSLRPLYQPSFVVQASQLDESLTQIRSVAFLHEYREPTLAVLFSPTRTWAPMLSVAKDTVRYLVLSLDLNARSSTAIVSVSNLPFDTDRVVPLPAPIGGSLLMGANQLIHVDAAGRLNSVAVNKYAEKSTDLSLSDQSHLDLHLEGAVVTPLAGTELLLITHSGQGFRVKFAVEGHRVYNFSLSPEPNFPLLSAPCTTTRIDDCVFVGCRGSDAALISYQRSSKKAASTNNNEDEGKVPLSEPMDEDANDDDLADIYGDNQADQADTSNTAKGAISLQLEDSLRSYGPISDLAVGKPYNSSESEPPFDIVAATGTDKAGALSIFQRSVRPSVAGNLRLPSCKQIWAVAPQRRPLGDTNSDYAAHDSYVVTSHPSEGSRLYNIGQEFVEVTSKRKAFVSKSPTVGIGAVFAGSVIVHVCQTEIAVYDAEFERVIKTFKLNSRAVSCSFIDPYAAVTLANGEFFLLQAVASEGRTRMERIKLPATIAHKVKSAHICESREFAKLGVASRGVKRKRAEEKSEPPSKDPVKVAFILTQNDDFQAFLLSDPAVSILYKDVSRLPRSIQVDSQNEAKPMDAPLSVSINRAIHCYLGDDVVKEEYIIFTTRSREIYLYRISATGDSMRFDKSNALTDGAVFQVYGAQERTPPLELVVLPDYGGRACVLIPGKIPVILMKDHQGPIRMHRFGTQPITGACAFHTNRVYKGLSYVDANETVNFGTLDATMDYNHSWPTKRKLFGESITSIAYHSACNVYVIATHKPVPYHYVDEDGNPLPGQPEDLPRAESYQGRVLLVSPLTWTVVDELDLDTNEVVMALKSVVLTVSEKTKKKKEVIVFGSSVLRGEDLAAKGSFYVYDIVDIVPEPGRPETKNKFKEIAQEAIKGAVTAVCEVEGHLLIAQAQKIIIRNLQEDNSIIPVAFMDLNIFISEAKALKNLVLLGDSMKSVVLAGFGQEPYRMTNLGKDLRDIEVTSGEFIVSSGRLYMVVADNDRRLHLLQYDPEDPSSLSGQRLVLRSEFYLGRRVNSSVLVPYGMEKGSQLIPLLGSEDGTLCTVLPLSETMYRSLFVIQQQIIEKEPQVACLNPREYRMLARSRTNQQQVGRMLLDYSVIRRFVRLAEDRKYQYSRKVSKAGRDEAWRGLRYIEGAFGYY